LSPWTPGFRQPLPAHPQIGRQRGRLYRAIRGLISMPALHAPCPTKNMKVTAGALRQKPSVITSKPAINDHFKTGQRSRAQNMKLFYRDGASSCKFYSVSA
jgi:hypothetical protein